MTSCNHQKQVISSDKAPAAIGPYSAAVSNGCSIFTAGQLGIDPATGDLVEGGIQAQTRQALNNLKAVLEAGGSDLAHVIKCTVFLKDINEFGQMNEIYGQYFTENFPARSAFQVAALPKGAAEEIEAVAIHA